MSIGLELRKLLILLSILLLLPQTAFALISAVEEADGSPSTYPWKIKFANGNVTDNGDGTVTIADQTGAGGGDAITVNTVAAVDPDFSDSIYTDIVNNANTLTWKPNYNAASGDIALAANELAFAVNGFVAEGATADAIELYFAIPDPAASDKTITFPNATDTLAGKATTDIFTNKTIAAADNVVGADTVEVVDSTDATSSIAMFDSATGSLAAKTDGGLTYAADTGTLTVAGSQTITVADASNLNGLTITQNDTTNDTAALRLVASNSYSATDGYPVEYVQNADGGSGFWVEFYQNSATPAANDGIGGEDFFGNDSTGTKTAYAYFNVDIVDPTNTSETGRFRIETLLSGSMSPRLTVGDAINGIKVGSTTAAGIVSSGGSQDLTLQTGNATTPTINLVDGASGDIQITPAAGGQIVLDGTIEVDAGVVTGATSITSTTINAFTTGGAITLAENTSVALDPAGSADGKYSGITVSGTAGAALAFGDVIVLDVTDSRWELADANAAAAADGDSRGLVGICVLAAAGDGSATTVLLKGTIRADAAFPALTVAAPVYISETAGDIVVTQPTTTDVVIKVLGFALTADEMYFNPSNDYITHT